MIILNEANYKDGSLVKKSIEKAEHIIHSGKYSKEEKIRAENYLNKLYRKVTTGKAGKYKNNSKDDKDYYISSSRNISGVLRDDKSNHKTPSHGFLKSDGNGNNRLVFVKRITKKDSKGNDVKSVKIGDISRKFQSNHYDWKKIKDKLKDAKQRAGFDPDKPITHLITPTRVAIAGAGLAAAGGIYAINKHKKEEEEKRRQQEELERQKKNKSKFLLFR